MIEHRIVIEKNPMTKIPRTVNAAELLVLKRLHGVDRVHLVESYELDPKFSKDFDPDQEIERLRTRYKTRKGSDNPVSVDAIFPAGALDVARVCGFEYGGKGEREVVPRSVVDLGESRKRKQAASAAAAEPKADEKASAGRGKRKTA